MPRLTQNDYLRTCHKLCKLWEAHSADFALLSYRDQLYLHDYFQPSKQLTPAQLLDHRTSITEDRPGLPQQAGRALAKLERALAATALIAIPVASAKTTHGKNRVLSVRAVARPEPDVHKLAEALIAMVKAGNSPSGPDQEESCEDAT